MILVSNAVATMSAQVDALQFCHFLTSTFQEVYDYHAIDYETLVENPAERLTASIAVFSRWHRQIWMIGDCQCLVDGQLFENPKPAERPNAKKRANFLERLLSKGHTINELLEHDLGRDFILPDIIKSTFSQNKTFSVVDGFPIPMEHVKVIDCSAAKEIVMATDGYPHLEPSLEASEQNLQQLLAEDPLCFRTIKATKGKMKGQCSFDDRSYIRFRV